MKNVYTTGKRNTRIIRNKKFSLKLDHRSEGKMSEWLKEIVLKTIVKKRMGSNPIFSREEYLKDYMERRIFRS